VCVLESLSSEFGSSGFLEKWVSPTFLRISPQVGELAFVVPSAFLQTGGYAGPSI